jgi:pilus assembly protein Flp/PilA
MSLSFMFTWLYHFLVEFHPRKDIEGQGLAEYALILVLVSIVAIVILALFGESIGSTFSHIICDLKDAANSGSCS